MIAQATAWQGVNPYAVASLPTSIQMGFRLKMLTLLSLQLGFMISIAFTLRMVPATRDALEKAFPPQSKASAALTLLSVGSLPLLSRLKHKHPWNLIATAAWSTLFALFVAATDLPGAYFRSHSLFLLLCELFGGILALTVLTQLRWDSKPIGIGTAGCISWLIWLITSSVIYANLQSTALSTMAMGAFVMVTIATSFLFGWVVYDAHKICCKLSPDEYMKGIIYFYTDMFYMCACCCLVACMGSATSNAP
mmetsp:Transcript_73639/g.163667  ORF Transcript_73639/g.163667 Transcript_73639/m.163667 type:complete len:251 (-) Transcript_73639:454-1206(-)